MDEVTASLNEAQKIYLSVLIDAGCKPLFRTNWFGKSYVMMKDPQGVHFAERLPDDE